MIELLSFEGKTIIFDSLQLVVSKAEVGDYYID